MRRIEETEHTLEDLMALPEDAKAELVDGTIYMMAPALARHSLVATQITGQIFRLIHEKKNPRKSPKDPDSWILLTEAWTYYDKRNIFVHDIAAFSKRDLAKLPERGPILAKPMWVCEILSPSNWTHDTQCKRLVLEQYKVPFFWLVDPHRKTIQVFEMNEGSKHYQIIYAAEVANGILKLPPFDRYLLDLREIFEGI